LFINMESIPKGRNDCQILLTMTVNLQVMNDNRTIIRDLDSDYHTYSVLTRTIIRDLGSDYHTYTVLTRTIIKSWPPLMCRLLFNKVLTTSNS
jgi:hypothetical protein